MTTFGDDLGSASDRRTELLKKIDLAKTLGAEDLEAKYSKELSETNGDINDILRAAIAAMRKK